MAIVGAGELTRPIHTGGACLRADGERLSSGEPGDVYFFLLQGGAREIWARDKDAPAFARYVGAILGPSGEPGAVVRRRAGCTPAGEESDAFTVA